ncbi:coproporphyrinogen dehydrogenase HemZ [Eubacterium sp. MSJ-33]|uniref:coproporphyrinogen dehydrogenase HemZ n=1 Tax=Eubacterium sp. MSJ-33 TaxID=2841528 RepID=UPI001C74533B|nr:coproporphyrinogen dehydrogenase HemZ [Eubacterium sp. MSJ-33]QWT52010.1 coproporphyrinogen dehydrogenase HemZ [Eubacterium sp. MSJ-33]
MILLDQNNQLYNNDLRAMIMAFYPGVKIVEDENLSDDFDLRLLIRYEEVSTILTVCKHGHACDKPDDLQEVPELPAYKDKLLISTCGLRAKILVDYRDKAGFRNILKMASYRLLGQFADRRLLWGDLTGVRPTKIAMTKLVEYMDVGAQELLGDSDETDETGVNGHGFVENVNLALAKQQEIHDKIVQYYRDTYDTSVQKAELATTVAENEHRLVKGIDLDNDYCLYVGIPFCPSRCLYCSFTSYPIGIYAEKARTYIDTLCKELAYVAEQYKHKRLVAIYIGGGTPTSISHELLAVLLKRIQTVFRLQEPEAAGGLVDFTVEAGRPDSITPEKLAVMKEYGVTRISINPQTMNDETLRTIGRAHNAAQVKEAFAMARQAGFDNINMDLIAGLPGEDLDSMRHTLAEVRALAPESLTVHSLAIKRAANLNQQMDDYKSTIHHDMDAMHTAAQETAQALGMEPYYLYRQKNIGGNLENVGYAKPGCECLYNILIMEEMTDIIAAGAGASTKLVYHAENRVERVENCKSVDDYINRFDEMLDRKRKAF